MFEQRKIVRSSFSEFQQRSDEMIYRLGSIGEFGI